MTPAQEERLARRKANRGKTIRRECKPRGVYKQNRFKHFNDLAGSNRVFRVRHVESIIRRWTEMGDAFRTDLLQILESARLTEWNKLDTDVKEIVRAQCESSEE